MLGIEDPGPACTAAQDTKQSWNADDAGISDNFKEPQCAYSEMGLSVVKSDGGQ